LSKLCGIYHFDARLVSAEDQARVRTALDRPGCFTPLMCRQPGLVMGWAAGTDTPHGHQPFESPARSVCLWDGRIDNRKDLLRQIGLRADCSDAAIVLSLYQRSGVDGLRDVVGDWSLCIWDANRREILLASDYAGIRPLYYYRSAETLYWCSSLADLVRWTGTSELDETYVASFLTRGSACGRTPYAGIFPVPAGHAVSIASGAIANRAFWTLPVHREIRYRDERQYEEQMLELFRESVQTRLAAGAPTCAELSGGLDSSSIVCMADRIQKESGNGSLITLSYTHENCPDERFFREVERACNLSGCHLPLQEYPAAADMAGAVPAWWEPRFRGLARRMAAMGSGVLLTGQCGDLIMGNTADDTGDVTEWLARGRLERAARAAYAWGRSMQVPVYPILWRSIREALFSWVPPMSPSAAVGAMPANTEDSLNGRSFAARASRAAAPIPGGGRLAAIPQAANPRSAPAPLLHPSVRASATGRVHADHSEPYSFRTGSAAASDAPFVRRTLASTHSGQEIERLVHVDVPGVPDAPGKSAAPGW
jgi:hypothetical protein